MTARERRIILATQLAARKLAKAANMSTADARRIVAAVLDVLPESGFCVTYARRRIDDQAR